MLNLVCLIGRLTKDAELVSTANGLNRVRFDIAFDSSIKDEEGNKIPNYITCVAFEKTAENVCSFCRRGSKVAISGRLQQRSFMRKDGSKGSVIEVICDSVEFLDPKPKEVQTEEPVIEEPAPVQAEPKFDPMTGKPLKPTKK